MNVLGLQEEGQTPIQYTNFSIEYMNKTNLIYFLPHKDFWKPQKILIKH
jgi:hypothetical protein